MDGRENFWTNAFGYVTITLSFVLQNKMVVKILHVTFVGGHSVKVQTIVINFLKLRFPDFLKLICDIFLMPILSIKP